MVGWTNRVRGTQRRTPTDATVTSQGGGTTSGPAMVTGAARGAVEAPFVDGGNDLDQAWPNYPRSSASVVIHAPRADAANRLSGASITVER